MVVSKYFAEYQNLACRLLDHDLWQHLCFVQPPEVIRIQWHLTCDVLLGAERNSKTHVQGHVLFNLH